MEDHDCYQSSESNQVCWLLLFKSPILGGIRIILNTSFGLFLWLCLPQKVHYFTPYWAWKPQGLNLLFKCNFKHISRAIFVWSIDFGRDLVVTFISNAGASAPKQCAVGQVMIIPPHTLYAPPGMALNSPGMISSSHTDIPLIDTLMAKSLWWDTHSRVKGWGSNRDR